MPRITGTVVSVTVMSCDVIAVLPLLSVEVYVTVVLPTGKPLGASLVTVTVPSTKSVADAMPIVTAELIAVASIETFAGVLIVGEVVSVMVTS